MQLVALAGRLALTYLALFAPICWSQVVPGPQTDWSLASYEKFSEALEGYYQERELKNLPAIRSAIVELRLRRSRNGEDQPQAMVFLAHFLQAQVMSDFIEQRRAGVIPRTLQQWEFAKRHPSGVEAGRIQEEALARFPNNALVLKTVLTSDLVSLDDPKAIELLKRLVAIEPTALVFRLTLTSALSGTGRVAEARRESVRLFQGVPVDHPNLAVVYRDLPALFERKGPGCEQLAQDLISLRDEVPLEFHRTEGGVEYNFKSESDRSAKTAAMQQVLARTRNVLAASSCGASP